MIVTKNADDLELHDKISNGITTSDNWPVQWYW